MFFLDAWYSGVYDANNDYILGDKLGDSLLTTGGGAEED
jgi:hypothetical protein